MAAKAISGLLWPACALVAVYGAWLFVRTQDSMILLFAGAQAGVLGGLAWAAGRAKPGEPGAARSSRTKLGVAWGVGAFAAMLFAFGMLFFIRTQDVLILVFTAVPAAGLGALAWALLAEGKR